MIGVGPVFENADNGGSIQQSALLLPAPKNDREAAPILAAGPAAALDLGGVEVADRRARRAAWQRGGPPARGCGVRRWR